ncbi:hypothetical protein [Acinetobacter larvae]|uniref:Uncharacterized protein n=1 Tax=Acinetobacter larvae TaxID=1789224 RepID=A0A1B2LY80_9GAMM|nr:hypothetical protein [Acinetobacter larvae]AOA57839.1 hypothetical protein BFG52_05380 [Acinetobacter larvae]
MHNHNSPEIIRIDEQNFGSHVEHWSLLDEDACAVVPSWLGQALNAPIMPMGLCAQESDMDPTTWLIQGPQHSAVMLNQVIDVVEHKPQAVKTAFPSFSSPYKIKATVQRIICSQSNSQAVLQLNLGANAVVYAFDTLYSVNHTQYQKQQDYAVQLNAWAYDLEKVADHEQIVVDDAASIKHHRALNDILSAHQGIAPDNLQELIDAWQPKSAQDLEPVTVDFSKMVAYLYGETLGQEDEAWFQGKIVGISSMKFMEKDIQLYDVTLMLEQNQPAILVRVAAPNATAQQFAIGQYIRGNIWIQAEIHQPHINKA